MAETIDRKRIFTEVKVGQKAYNLTAAYEPFKPYREYPATEDITNVVGAAKEVLTLTLATGVGALALDTSISISLRDESPIAVTVAAGDTAAQVGVKIIAAAAAFLPNWVVGGALNVVTFTYKFNGIGTGFSKIIPGDTGVTGAFVITPGVGNIAYSEYLAALTALDTALTAVDTFVTFPTDTNGGLSYNMMACETDDPTISIKKYTRVISGQVASIELIEQPWRSYRDFANHP